MTDHITIPNEIIMPEVARMLAEGNSVIILTKGNSMLPFIVGQKDSVELVARDDYFVGDIVLAKTEKCRWVLHRIINISETVVQLKGDGNLDGTETCKKGDIAGAVRFIIRRSGKKIDVGSSSFVKKSAKWIKLPRIVRRYTLGICRRTITH